MFVVTLLCAPVLLSEYHLFQIGLIASTAVIAVGLTLVTGITGQISLAQAAFAAMGGYGAALLATHWGISAWFGVPISAVVAAVAGYLLGIASLRVEGHYLALATLAFTAIVGLVLLNWTSLTGGAVGLAVPPLTAFGEPLTSGRQLYYVIIPVAVVMFAMAHCIVQSRFGRAFSALRQSEVAAQTLGVNLLHLKALAFALSAFYGAIGGGLQALQTTYLDPTHFSILLSVYFVSIIVVGGLRAISGAIYGSVIFVMAPEFLAGFETFLGFMFALVLLAVLVFFPRGIAGLAESLVGMAGWSAGRPVGR